MERWRPTAARCTSLTAGAVLLCLACNATTSTPKGAASPKPKARVAALIDFDQLPQGPILQTKLQARSGLVWVERDAIDRVLLEQKLQGIFGSAAPRERVRLGHLLKADLLILLRKSMATAEPPQSAKPTFSTIDVVIAETEQGLRLDAHSIPTSADATADAKLLGDLIDRSLQRNFDTRHTLVAVSPFLSGDLAYKYDYQKTAYAKIIEQSLRDDEGLWLVELAEAQALTAR